MQLRLSQIALALIGLMIGGSSSAAPLSYGAYYDETGVSNCGASLCRLNFSQTPTDKLVMVRKVNCAITSSSPVYQGFLFIATTNGGAAISRNLPLPIAAPIAISGGNYATNLESDIHWLIGQGRFPGLAFVTSVTANIGVSCTITGDLIDPIP